MLLLIGIVVGLLLGSNSPAAAQGSTPFGSNSTPLVGGSGGIQLPRFSGSQNASAQLHLGPTGKPCLRVLGQVTEQKINHNIFNHMIIVDNDCSQRIKMQVCYYKSEHCILIDILGYGHKQSTLGIMAAMKEFRFEYKEQFDQGTVFGAAGIRLH